MKFYFQCWKTLHGNKHCTELTSTNALRRSSFVFSLQSCKNVLPLPIILPFFFPRLFISPSPCPDFDPSPAVQKDWNSSLPHSRSDLELLSEPSLSATPCRVYFFFFGLAAVWGLDFSWRLNIFQQRGSFSTSQMELFQLSKSGCNPHKEQKSCRWNGTWSVCL